MLSLLELPPPPVELDGIDLTSILRGEVPARPRTMGFLHGKHEAFSRGRWKVLRSGDDPPTLHDLDTDPAEAIDLAADHPEHVADLVRRLDAWRAAVLADAAR